jgi:hypothetical protein
MCELCLPRISRRDALRLGLGAAGAITLGTADLVTAGVPPPIDFVTPDGLVIKRREVWAGTDRPPRGAIAEEDVLFLLVHHSATPNGLDPIAVMRSAYQFHTAEKGWPDVAYNFFIDRFGTVYEGRTGSLDGPTKADATGGNQGSSHLVCLLGDFTAELPTVEALDALDETLAWLADRYDIDTTPNATVTFLSEGSNKWPSGSEVTAVTISGHRDMSRTACPGDAFYPILVADVPGRVDALRTARTASSTTTTSTTSTPTTTEGSGATTTTTTSTSIPPTAATTGQPTTARATGGKVDTTAAPSPNPPTGDGDDVPRVAIALGTAAAVAVAGGLGFAAVRSGRSGSGRDEVAD